MKETILQNLTELHGQIADACEEHGRDMDDITIVAVTKGHPPGTVKTAVACGLHNIGESRVQEAEAKIEELGRVARFHMVGHLQTNKARKAVELFDVIQSVDSLKLAAELNIRAAEADRTVECLLQVNCSGEAQKFGLPPEETLAVLDQALKLPNLSIIGLMTIGPLTEDESTIRAAFARCRTLFDQARKTAGDQFDTLSMGMSHDFTHAIAEGATMVRIGTSIFGPRPS